MKFEHAAHVAGSKQAIAAGTLDPPTGLKTVVQIHVNSAGDYYKVDPSIRQRPD